MPPEVRKHLFDMQQAVLGIEMFVSGRIEAELEQDLILRSAVERQFGIIREAPTRLRKADPQMAERITEWRRIIGFRNVLIHGYDSLDTAVTWRIVQDKLPILRRELVELLNRS